MTRLMFISAEENFSGGETVLLNFAHQFSIDPNFEVDMLVKDSSVLSKKLIKEVKYNNINLLESTYFQRISESSALKYLISIFIGNYKLLKLIIRRKPDVVIYNGIGPSIYGILTKLFTFKKVIVIHHNIKINRLYELYAKYLIGLDIFVCVSNAVKKSIESKLNEKKLRVVYNGVDIINKSYSEKFDQPQNIRLVMAGHITRWKGFHIFLEAIKILREKKGGLSNEVLFEILGEPWTVDEKEYYDELNKYVITNSLSSHVKFLGFLPLVELLPDMHYLIHASIEPEPLGMVLIEGMQYGCIVLASNSGGAPEIITQGKDGFLYTPGDSKELADLLERLIYHTDKTDLYKISLNAMDTINERFNSINQTSAYKEIIEEILL